MLLARAYLLLLWGMLAALVPVGYYGSPRHFLLYSYLRVSESSWEMPQFFSVILLDDQPIARYDNHTNRMEPLVPWMEAEETENLVSLEEQFRADLEWLSKLSHQTAGLHTWQVILDCELKEDGSKERFLRYGYDGMDFISLDKENLTWVVAQLQAQKVKETWDNDPRRSKWYKGCIEMCIKRMQKYNQKESLKKTEPPVGKVTCQVNDSLEVLICQAYGFYPKEIQVNWTKDGEVCLYGILHRNMTPNSDGTYHYLLSIRIDPKERDRYQCHVEHEGLQEPLDLDLKEPTDSKYNTWLIIIGCVIAVLAVIVIVGILAFIYFRKRRQDGYKAAPSIISISNRGSNSSDQGRDTESNISDHGRDTESNSSDQGSNQTLSNLLPGDPPSIKIEE